MTGYRWGIGLVVALVWLGSGVVSGGPAPGGAPVLIGLDAEFGHKSSTSDDAVRAGILVAIREINQGGGVLGGRPLELVERDNRSVPARGVKNLKELAGLPDLVAVFCAKFSPVVIEELPTIHQLGLPLLDPWAAADPIVDNGYSPNYVFRLSLRDGWAMPAMLDHAAARGARRVGLLIANTAWGRSNQAAAARHLADHPEITLVGERWYNWGDDSLLQPYRELLAAGAEALILIANEREGSILIREVAALPEGERLPILSHWGVSGGALVELAGAALQAVDFAVVQTYSFIGDESPTARRVVEAAGGILGVEGARAIPSPVGVAHAYDLTHLLALAIDRAGSTDRAAIREALEGLGRHEGLIRTYDPPFTRENHEALAPELLFMGRYEGDGAIVRVIHPRPLSPGP